MIDRDRRRAGAWRAVEAQRALADALPALIMVSDAEGAVQFFNRRWYEYTGQPPLDLGGATDWASSIHPDDATRVREDWFAAVTRGDRLVKMRYRLREHRTGAYRWFDAQAVASEDAAGRITHWIGTAIDVDDEVIARETLQEMLATQTAIAELYQRASLPEALPRIAGLQFDAEYRPSAEATLVGGDWYDAAVLRDGRIVFSIGDVTGHGIEAAVQMSRVRQAIFTAAVNEPDAAEILRRVNRVMRMQGTIATALVGIVDLVARTVVIASAGHPRPLVVHPDHSVRELVSNGMPLGVVDELTCETVTLPAQSGMTLVAYTDGLIEFDRRVEAAEQRLHAACRRDRGPIVGAAARLRDAVMDQAQAPDDVALLVVHFTVEAPPA